MNNVNLVKMKVEGSSKSHSRADIISRDVESVIDEPEARGGTNLGLTPTETLLASLIGCSNVITHRIAEKQGVKIENLDIRADAKFDKSGASIIKEIEVTFPEVILNINIKCNANENQFNNIMEDRLCWKDLIQNKENPLSTNLLPNVEINNKQSFDEKNNTINRLNEDILKLKRKTPNNAFPSATQTSFQVVLEILFWPVGLLGQKRAQST